MHEKVENIETDLPSMMHENVKNSPTDLPRPLYGVEVNRNLAEIRPSVWWKKICWGRTRLPEPTMLEIFILARTNP
jgi:hypothetical protein